MGILDRIFGSDKAPKQGQATQQEGQPPDEHAIARYQIGRASCRERV